MDVAMDGLAMEQQLEQAAQQRGRESKATQDRRARTQRGRLDVVTKVNRRGQNQAPMATHCLLGRDAALARNNLPTFDSFECEE